MRIGPYIGTRSATPAGFRPQSAYMAPQNRTQQTTNSTLTSILNKIPTSTTAA